MEYKARYGSGELVVSLGRQNSVGVVTTVQAFKRGEYLGTIFESTVCAWNIRELVTSAISAALPDLEWDQVECWADSAGVPFYPCECGECSECLENEN